MNNLAKVLIGVGVVGAVAVGAYAVTKKSEKKMIVLKDFEEDGTPICEEKKETVMDRAKNFVMKKAVKFMTFVLLHEKEVTAVATILSVVGATFQLVNAVKEYRLGKDLHKKLKRIDAGIDKLGCYIEHCTGVINDNLRTVDGDIIKVADKIGVQILAPGEVL